EPQPLVITRLGVARSSGQRAVRAPGLDRTEHRCRAVFALQEWRRRRDHELADGLADALHRVDDRNLVLARRRQDAVAHFAIQAGRHHVFGNRGRGRYAIDVDAKPGWRMVDPEPQAGVSIRLDVDADALPGF